MPVSISLVTIILFFGSIFWRRSCGKYNFLKNLVKQIFISNFAAQFFKEWRKATESF